MGYIERNLLQDEDITYKTKLHWIIYINPLFLITIGGFCFWLEDIEQNQVVKTILTIVGSFSILFSIINGL